MELAKGFAYKFEASDAMLDWLMDFVKTERQCCDFFDFDMSVSSNNIALLKITGAEGAKDFIVSELNM
jgi:translation elongation factor EF-1alpha